MKHNKIRQKQFGVFFILALLLMTPIAFASEFQLKKVSELQPGDVIIDNDGEEVQINTITAEYDTSSQNKITKEKVKEAFSDSFKTIGNIINGRVYGNPITGNAWAAPKRTATEDYASSTFEIGRDEYVVEKGVKLDDNKDFAGARITGPKGKMYADLNTAGNWHFYKGTEEWQITPTEEYLIKGVDGEWAVTAEDKLPSEISRDAKQSKKIAEQSKTTKVGKEVTSSSYLKSSGATQTQSSLGFAGGQLLQGVQWAGVVAGLVQIMGPLFGDDFDTNSASAALAAGIMAGKLWYGVFAKEGIAGKSLSGTKAGAFLGSPLTATVIGAGVAWWLYTSMYENKEKTTQTVSFQCLPWQAPHGGADCELCNDDNLPCSEYRCKSLGQSCGIINPGTEFEKCVNQNPRDTNPPVVSPWIEKLTTGYKYTDIKTSPPGPGFKIKKSDGNGCIKPFTPIEFGVQTDEPAQCKIDIKHTEKFEDMATYIGGDNIYKYNHSEELALPQTKDLQNASIFLDNGKEMTLFLRCRDSNGNFNEAEYAIRFCVDPAPDALVPQIKGTSVSNNGCVAADSENATVDFYVNEPAECKWSFIDQGYDNMQYNMSCATTSTQINMQQLYTCRTTLTGIARDGTNFYVKCKDQPQAPENDRNTNAESYKFSLRGSSPLKIKNLIPNGTIYGGVSPAPIELYVETLFGCDDNKAICYYSTSTSESSFIKFFDTDTTDGIHTQRLDLYGGTHTYYYKCVDSGGNLAINSTTFKLEIDANAPVIARVYEEDDYLKVVTVRDSECVYTNNGCDFLFQEGTEMPYADSKIHVTEWLTDKTYYIKCRDEFRNEEADCSLIVRPTDNFL